MEDPELVRYRLATVEGKLIDTTLEASTQRVRAERAERQLAQLRASMAVVAPPSAAEVLGEQMTRAMNVTLGQVAAGPRVHLGGTHEWF